MTATVTTWLDGRVQTVPADDPRLAQIELRRHIANLHRIDVRGRREYFAEYERAHGLKPRLALQDAFAADWERRGAQR